MEKDDSPEVPNDEPEEVPNNEPEGDEPEGCLPERCLRLSKKMTKTAKLHKMTCSILTPKKRKFKLMVEEAIIDDASIVHLHPDKMEELDLMQGDTVILRGKLRKKAPAAVDQDEDLHVDKIRMNRTMRVNLGVRVGDIVAVMLSEDMNSLTRIAVTPFADSIEELEWTQDLAMEYLKAYFIGGEEDDCAYRPVMTGNYFIVGGDLSPVEFKIVACEGGEEEVDSGVVAPTTIVICEEEPIIRSEEEELLNAISYEDIGGCRKALALVREIVELPLRHPILFKNLGVKPPRGVLLMGPPGCGKTLISKAVKNESGAYFIHINGP